MSGQAEQGRGRSRWLGALLAFLLALGSAAASPSAASAGPGARFVVLKCDPALPAGGTEGAVFHGQPPFAGANNCAERGGSIFIIQQGNVASPSSAYWSLPLPAPPGGYTESVTVTGSMCSGAYADVDTVAWAVRGGWPENCATQTRTFAVDSPEGDPGIVYLGCEGQCLASPEAWAGGFAAREVDPAPPQVQGLGGTLFSGAPLHGHQSVEGTATDLGGGVASLHVRVNGEPLASRASDCGGTLVANSSYVGIVVSRPTPCPPKAEASWTVDTSAYPFQEGANSVSVCAQDFSTIGVSNEGCQTQRVSVDNSCPESPIAGGEVLSAHFNRSGNDTITVPFGRGARLSGRLRDSAGDPIAGATICITTSAQGGHGHRALTTRTTDAAGHFSYRLAAGPNRRIVLGYRRDATELDQTIRYRAHARPHVRISPARVRPGGRIRITGRLPGPSAAGHVVVLQAAALRGRWLTFRRATTGSHGRFTIFYRFGASANVTYRLRAVSPRQRGYPYAPGHSKASLVRVGG